MNKLIIVLIILSILSNCKNESSEITGRWVAVTSNELTEILIFDFQQDNAYLVDGENNLMKSVWEIYDGQLILQDYSNKFYRYQLIDKGEDSLLLKSQHRNILLLKESLLEYDLPVSSDKFKESLLNSTWKLIVVGEMDGEQNEKVSKLEFLRNGNLLLFGYDKNINDYTFSHVMKWQVVCEGKLSIIKLSGIVDTNFFVESYSDNLIKGQLISAQVDPKSLKTVFENAKIEREEIDNIKSENIHKILRGGWKNIDQNLEPYINIPNHIVITEEFGDLTIFTPEEPSNELNQSSIKVNNTCDLLLLNNLELGSNNIFIIKEINEDTLKLRFPKSIKNYTFIKTTDEINEENFF